MNSDSLNFWIQWASFVHNEVEAAAAVQTKKDNFIILSMPTSLALDVIKWYFKEMALRDKKKFKKNDT